MAGPDSQAPCATPEDAGAHALQLDNIQLESGDVLPRVQVRYETWGKLSDAKDNAVLLCHALTGDSHAAKHDAGDRPGWWDLVVGPGKFIDTDRWFVVCSNVLGGCSGTTGPGQIDPATGRPMGTNFPPITIGDMADVQAGLCDALGIEQLHAVIGGSMGGHQALAWATRHGRRVRNCIVVASSARLSSQALAFDIVGRNAILQDQSFNNGKYYDQPRKPAVGLALARMLAHITYLSRDGMTAKFDPVRDKPRNVDSDFEKLYGVGSYLAHQGDKFVERFDANSYITITRAEDQFDLGEGGDALAERFRSDTDSGTRFGIISFSSDWLFPPEQSRQIVEGLCKAGRRTSYIEVTSGAGHDAFLLPNEVDQYGGFIRAMLEGEAATTTPAASDVSVFGAHRLDYDAMLELIPPGSRVLDLGCGDGGLLARLKQRGDQHLLGIDVQTANVLAAVGRGLDVIDADLNQPLRFFSDAQFDVVVLSQTLQSVESTLGVLGELMRVGRRAVVSFPNFGYGPLREMLYRDGRSPKAGGYAHEWYDSPNRRFPTILDFRELCEHLGLRIDRHRYLRTSDRTAIDDESLANRDADLAVVLLEAGSSDARRDPA